MWGPPGTFSPDSLESDPGDLRLWGQSLFQCGPLQTGHGAGGSLDAKEMATHSSVLAWRIPGMGEPAPSAVLGWAASFVPIP